MMPIAPLLRLYTCFFDTAYAEEDFQFFMPNGRSTGVVVTWAMWANFELIITTCLNVQVDVSPNFLQNINSVAFLLNFCRIFFNAVFWAVRSQMGSRQCKLSFYWPVLETNYFEARTRKVWYKISYIGNDHYRLSWFFLAIFYNELWYSGLVDGSNSTPILMRFNISSTFGLFRAKRFLSHFWDYLIKMPAVIRTITFTINNHILQTLITAFISFDPFDKQKCLPATTRSSNLHKAKPN